YPVRATIIEGARGGSRSIRETRLCSRYNPHMPTSPLDDARAFLADWVRPRAGAIDQDLPALREALLELGRRGYLGLRIPREFGGLDLGALDFRRFQEA